MTPDRLVREGGGRPQGVVYRDDASLDTGNVEDRRDGGAGRTLAVEGGGLGIVAVIVVVPPQVLGGGGGSGTADQVGAVFDQLGEGQRTDNGQLAASCRTGANANSECAIVADIESVQDYWGGALGARHQPVDTVFFQVSTQTGCGAASSGTGPFYCPADQLVDIDLSFFEEVRTRSGAEGGSFVNAYVLAHEYGHHVQNLLATAGSVQPGETGRTSGSVRLELQADCSAGTWANHATTVPDDSSAPLISEITDDDVARALDRAARIGDDFIQTNLGEGSTDPGSSTHETSQQRQRWFGTGFAPATPRSATPSPPPTSGRASTVLRWRSA